MTSAGQLVPQRSPPYFVLIDRALRDEGTSYHYLPPADFSVAKESLLAAMQGAFDGSSGHRRARGDLDDRRAVPRDG